MDGASGHTNRLNLLNAESNPLFSDAEGGYGFWSMGPLMAISMLLLILSLPNIDG